MSKSKLLKSKTKKLQSVRVGPYRVGPGGDLLVVAGPCVIESEKSVFKHAKHLKTVMNRLRVPFVFKASYDKANRTSVDSFRGPGLKRGIEILKQLKKELGILILSDVHSPHEVELAASVLDVIQIPAFLCRQTDLLVEAGRTGKVVNIKKGQFLAPEDMAFVANKVRSTGNHKIILTERGASFGYRTLVSDFRSILIMREMGFPVIFDATHSVQRPGGLGKASGGDSKYAPALARAAVAVGADGVFMEVHENPSKALSDGPNSLPLKIVPQLLKDFKQLRQVTRHVR